MGKRLKREKSRIIFMLVFGLPTLAGYLYFCFSPIFESIYTSFYQWSGFSDMHYVGISNYVNILKDPLFFKAIKNDLFYVLGKEILIVPLAFLFAVALTRMKLKSFEVKTYRFLFFLPNVLSVVIIGILWAFIYDPYNGLLNAVLEAIGLESIIPAKGWLVEYTMPSVIVVASWCGIGLFMIILISAINGIPKDLYEAAEIDGATQWQQLWNITYPCIRPQLSFVITNVVFGTLGNYGLVMAMTNGGVNGSGMVMGLYVYQHSIDSMSPQVGYSNAAAILLLIICATLTLLVNKWSAGRED